jgi:predicted nucleic acid-binding protein
MTFSPGVGAVVVDASVAVEVLQGNEDWLARWTVWIEGGTLILAPASFLVEVANALLRGVGLPPDIVASSLDLLDRAGFETTDRGLDGMKSSVSLAQRHRLSVYDAVYLDLAIDTDAELATLDGALRDAAIAEEVGLAD